MDRRGQSPMRIEKGFADAERAEIASLYWQAFGPKLGRVMGPGSKAVRMLAEVLSPSHAICARGPDGGLLGVVGFKTADGALADADWPDMLRHYGTFGALWRVAALALLERDIDNDRFLTDGIFVNAAARGKGVGTALLDALADEARTRGYASVRLDVIDTNPRARVLYERCGYVAVDTQSLGVFSHLFGFKRATTMVRQLQ